MNRIAMHPDREQLQLVSHELQTRLGKKYCAEADLPQLLFTHRVVSRVRTIEVEVRALDGGASFKITLRAPKATVGEGKKEIARVTNRSANRQTLYTREDGVDAGQVLDDLGKLEDGQVVTLAVKQLDDTRRAYINLHVIENTGEVRSIGVCKTDTMEASVFQRHYGNGFFQRYCLLSERHYGADKLLFFTGVNWDRRIDGNHTPELLRLEDNDEIYCAPRQEGNISEVSHLPLKEDTQPKSAKRRRTRSSSQSGSSKVDGERIDREQLLFTSPTLARTCHDFNLHFYRKKGN
jgi:hypothetical protein